MSADLYRVEIRARFPRPDGSMETHLMSLPVPTPNLADHGALVFAALDVVKRYGGAATQIGVALAAKP